MSLEPTGPGRRPWGVTHAGTVRDLIAEGDDQLAYMAEQIARVNGQPLANVRRQLDAGGMDYIRDFAQDSTSIFDATGPELMDTVQHLARVTGMTTEAEAQRIAQRAESNLVQGAEDALLASGALNRLGAGVENEVVNSAAHVASQVFGHNTRAAQVLGELGETIVRQFFR